MGSRNLGPVLLGKVKDWIERHMCKRVFTVISHSVRIIRINSLTGSCITSAIKGAGREAIGFDVESRCFEIM